MYQSFYNKLVRIYISSNPLNHRQIKYRITNHHHEYWAINSWIYHNISMLAAMMPTPNMWVP